MRVLITGGFGYVGGRLAQHLLSQGGNEVVLGTRRTAAPPAWAPDAEVVQTQWDSKVALEEICEGIGAVVMAAGMNAQDSMVNPVGALELNGLATARLLDAAIAQGVRRVVYVSTAHVYGSPLAGVITEDTCPVSLHPYATSHRAGEDVVRAAQAEGAIEGIVARLSNGFGAPAHAEANCWMLLVNDLVQQAVTTGRMVLRSSGLQRRDFIPMAVACDAMAFLLNARIQTAHDALFNVGGGTSPTVLEMTHRVAERIRMSERQEPEIFADGSVGSEATGVLDYRMDRLTDLGFVVDAGGSADDEIDGLIRFCTTNMT
jgi:UDP-glucose 4-epimerase